MNEGGRDRERKGGRERGREGKREGGEGCYAKVPQLNYCMTSTYPQLRQALNKVNYLKYSLFFDPICRQGEFMVGSL